MRRICAEGVATGNATFETEVPAREVLYTKWIRGHRWVAEIDGEVAGWGAATPVSARECYSGVAETSIYTGAGFREVGTRERTVLHHGVWRDTALLERRRAD